jgi:hypothetical protein
MLKLGLLLLVGAVLLANNRDRLYPFVHWPMYAEMYPYPNETVQGIELRVVDSAGVSHPIQAHQLYTFMGVPGAGPRRLSQKVIQSVFLEEDAAARDLYRNHLMGRIRAILPGVEVVEIQGWRLTWAVDAEGVPPIDYDQPIEAEMFGQYQVADDSD